MAKWKPQRALTDALLQHVESKRTLTVPDLR